MSTHFDNDRFFPATLEPGAFNVDYLMRTYSTTREQAEEIVEHNKQAEVWKNSRYTVVIRTVAHEEGGPDLKHLSIKRNDREAIHDWRDLQEIKNALVGDECEGVEIYPAESRRVDSANQYHLWVVDDPTFRMPFGFGERLVTDEPRGRSKQRAFEQSER